jgi:hypothetical protein
MKRMTYLGLKKNTFYLCLDANDKEYLEIVSKNHHIIYAKSEKQAYKITLGSLNESCLYRELTPLENVLNKTILEQLKWRLKDEHK